MRGVDHQSQIPYYVQLKEVIRERIKNGVWAANEQLPTEAELCDMFSISRTVVRQALQDLMHEGLITRRKGKGSFVAPSKISEQLVQKLTGFYHDMVAQGYTPVTQVLKQEVVPAPRGVAEHFGFDEGTPVIEIVRLRYVEETPIVLVTSYLPYDLCPALIDEDLSNQSLYDVLEKRFTLYIARGRRVMQAVPASKSEARYLQVNEGAPLFLLESTSYLDDGMAVEYYLAYHVGERSQFEVELIRLREPSDETQISALPPSNQLTSLHS